MKFSHCHNVDNFIKEENYQPYMLPLIHASITPPLQSTIQTSQYSVQPLLQDLADDYLA